MRDGIVQKMKYKMKFINNKMEDGRLQMSSEGGGYLGMMCV